MWCNASSALGACLLSLQPWDIDGLPSVCSKTWCSSLCIFRQCQGFQGYARFVDEAVWTYESWVHMDSSWFSLVGRMVGATGKISENCPPEVCWCKFVDPHRAFQSVSRDRGLYQFQALDFCWRWHRGQRAFDTCAFSAWAQLGLLQSSLWEKLSWPWEFGSEMAALPEYSSAVLVRMVVISLKLPGQWRVGKSRLVVWCLFRVKHVTGCPGPLVWWNKYFLVVMGWFVLWRSRHRKVCSPAQSRDCTYLRLPVTSAITHPLHG